MKTQENEHRHQVEQNGDAAMGFSHEKTSHHFLLRPKGGAIQVDANSASDVPSRNQIRAHLRRLPALFKAGDFNLPTLVHSTTPPGTETMSRLKEKIRYSYEDSPQGGRVVISTRDKEALSAIHEFLAFQIKDHNTGDPLTVDAAKA